MRRATLSAVLLLTLFTIVPLIHAGQAPANDLDTFMAKVLARRKVNLDALKDYVLNDFEQMEVFGPGDYTLFRDKREYVWYVRDGVHVRSPMRFNGVTIGKGHLAEAKAAINRPRAAMNGAQAAFTRKAEPQHDHNVGEEAAGGGCGTGDTSQRDELLAKISEAKKT